jgi:hypothetical protein
MPIKSARVQKFIGPATARRQSYCRYFEDWRSKIESYWESNLYPEQAKA